MGLLAWVGIALAIAVLVFALRTRKWALLIFVTPGALLGFEGAQGQASVAKSLGVFMMFFAIAALVIGIPLSALYLYWTRRRRSRTSNRDA